MLAIDLNIGDVVLEDGGDVDLKDWGQYNMTQTDMADVYGLVDSNHPRKIELSGCGWKKTVVGRLTTMKMMEMMMKGTNLREGALGENTAKEFPVSLLLKLLISRPFMAI